MKKTTWRLYILKARDGSLYTGVTTDLERRVLEHNCGRGSRCLRGRLPATLVYRETFQDRSSALKREFEIKQWTRQKKLNLISRNSTCARGPKS